MLTGRRYQKTCSPLLHVADRGVHFCQSLLRTRMGLHSHAVAPIITSSVSIPCQLSIVAIYFYYEVRNFIHAVKSKGIVKPKVSCI
jgi:hypothetical protein